jgi:hypothetical protein
MLRVAIELLPDGLESGKGIIATVDIARVSGGARGLLGHPERCGSR